MTLRDFIRAMTKDIQDAAAEKAAATEQPSPQQKARETGKAKANVDEEEKIEKEVPALIRKKSRRNDRAEMERDITRKRRKKRKAKKAEYEPR